MEELKIINDIEKNNNLNENENFLSKKEIKRVEKIEIDKNKYNLELKESTLNMNINTLENKENIDNRNIIANTDIKKNNEKKFDIKTNSVLQEKLKKIFKVREKRKFEYNKQEIPENLKYNSESSNSDIKKEKENKKNEESKKISVIKRQNSNVLKKENISKNINKQEKENNSPNNKNNINKEKKTKSFNQKIVNNYLNETNKKKNTGLKDIIEKLKAQKIEKEELNNKEKKEKLKEIPKKINENNNEKEIKVKNNKNKNLIPRGDKRNNYKKNIYNKNPSNNENILLPHKTYRDENDEDEMISFNYKIRRNNSTRKSLIYRNKEIKNKNENIFNRKKKLNSIDTTYQQIYNNKNIINIDMNNTIYNTTKKLDNSNNINNIIYKPKKPSLVKMGSRLRIALPFNPLFNKNDINTRNNFFKNNNSTKSIFNTNIKYENKKNSYIKKSELNYLNMNNSFFDNHNDSMIGNNISCLDINNNLNSSFDSLIKCNNDIVYGINLNNNNMNLLSGRATHSSLIKRKNDNLIQNNKTQMYLLNLNNKYNNIETNRNYSSLNIEDLLILEEKINGIIQSLNNIKMIHNECFEFWNYYFNCSLYCKLEKLFTNIYESNEVRISLNYLLLTVMVCYDYSFNTNIIKYSYQIFDNILKLNRGNLIFIFQHVLYKISNDSRDNIWVFRLNDLVNSYININDNSKINIVNNISNNSRIIMQNLSFLLRTYKTENNAYIYNIFENINTKKYEDINILFREKIFRVENINGSVLASIFLKENNKFKTEPAPYLKTINRKPYSLILDLDETLVHFKINPDNCNEGVLRVRPGIIEFLENIDKYYELIIFTAATQEYADLLIDAIEENKIYFEHRLYRQHTTIIGNDFIKDLSRVGRPLDKIAIVDNMPQNFRLQKENGINIKAFWGEEVYDTALIDLGNILINIAKDGGDIRDGIIKYKDEIVKKVTSNISKH